MRGVCKTLPSAGAPRGTPADRRAKTPHRGAGERTCALLGAGAACPVLDAFIVSNRDKILAGAQARVAARDTSSRGPGSSGLGLPLFLDQLVEALRRVRAGEVVDREQIGKSGGHHGEDLLRLGVTIGQVVHDYGDICQTVTELAIELEAPLSDEEFQTLNLCLDDAIAGAVGAYSLQREHTICARGSERLGALAHELRNLLNTAILSFDGIQSGHVSPNGSTGVVHARSLLGLRDLLDRSLAEVRLDAGISHSEAISAAELVEGVEIGALLQARARGLQLAFPTVEPGAMVYGDHQILAAALSNLVQNAIKFTRKQSSVSLAVRVVADRILFEIGDECGGLPAGNLDELFLPFEQRGADRTGSGLGLSICAKAAKACGGEIRVQDFPGKGCLFTLDLPRHPAASLAVVRGGKEGLVDAGGKAPPARAGKPRTTPR